MDDLKETIACLIERNRTDQRINPSWVAGEAMKALDPDRASPPAVYGGCNMWARQVARELLRSKFETAEEDRSQHDLFPELQWRYPTARVKGSEPEYVLLENMTAEDIKYNVDRLRGEADAKLKHADALEDFGARRRAAA